MPQPKRKRSGKPPGTNGRQSLVRDGGTHLNVRNSGREVWLYDDANLATIRAGATDGGSGGAPANLVELTRQGIVLGYSLHQDDDLEIAIHVGDPLTEPEMSVARWLEPQMALLRLPSGKLCVESNDASRIGPEQPTETGGLTSVPPGDYRVTLYRIDHEALFREGLTWSGPPEVIVLTPGGSSADAADDLLPFHERRDSNWVGQYHVAGKRAEALAWFDSYWDTFVVNLDSNAASQLSLAPGSYIRTHIPIAGITLISVFAKSWEDAKRLPLPTGIDLDEYGYAALRPMSEWNGAEALACHRETAKTRVEHQHQYGWKPAIVEILDVRPVAPTGRVFAATQLGAKMYFDSEFLTLVLSDVIPEAADLDELPLPKALDLLGKKLGEMGLVPQGDFSWQEQIRVRSVEASCRLYAGLPDAFAAILAGDGSFELIFLSELDDGTWIVTGFADEIDRRIVSKGPNGLPVPHPHVQFQTMDESLTKIFAAHKALLRTSRQPIPAPTNREQCVGAFGRFLAVAFG